MSEKNREFKNVGGQALIEGVMMRGEGSVAIAVRKPDGEIEVDVKPITPITKKYKFLSLPFIRGSVSLIDSMITGIKAITYSAQFFDEGGEEEEKSKFDVFLEKVFKDKTEDVLLYFSLVVAIFLAVGLFILLPTFLADIARIWTKSPGIINAIEGVLRISAFLAYVSIISKMKDIQRVFQYHGAEHKAIYCYESGQDLTVDNAKRFTTLHPRCGTSFLLIVMVTSILVFSFFGLPNPLLKAAIRIVMMPLIAGISYEIIRWAGKSKSKLVGIISYPGMMLQKMTTREPDDSQLEVAIRALVGVLPQRGED